MKSGSQRLTFLKVLAIAIGLLFPGNAFAQVSCPAAPNDGDVLSGFFDTSPISCTLGGPTFPTSGFSVINRLQNNNRIFIGFGEGGSPNFDLSDYSGTCSGAGCVSPGFSSGFFYTCNSANGSCTINHSYTQNDGAIVSFTLFVAAGSTAIGPFVASGGAFDLPNLPPTADAGADQVVASAALVTLDGTGSADPDAGQTLSYAWMQTGGSPVALSDPTVPNPTFTSPTLAEGEADTQLTFSLVVTDDLGLASPSDTVVVAVQTGPGVVLSGGPATLSNTAPFTITATFSKDVTGFDDLASDVIVTNGTVSAISGGPAIYALTIVPAGAGDVSIVVPAAAAQDSAGNDNFASTNRLVVSNQIVEITQEKIASFMLARANNLTSSQPRFTRFLDARGGCGGVNATANQSSGTINGCVAQGGAWVEVASAWSEGGSYTLGTVGAHGFVASNLIIGGTAQVDYSDDPSNDASGRGWMVGPYFVMRLPGQEFYVEGSLLYGQTRNEITPIEGYSDTFETERWLAQLRTTGEYVVRSTTLLPVLEITHTEDHQRAYRDQLGNTIPSQTVSLTQLSAGLDFTVPVSAPLGAWTVTGGMSGIYSRSDGAAAAPAFEHWRGRTHLGLNGNAGFGAAMTISAFYDGFGTDYESFGAKVGFDWAF